VREDRKKCISTARRGFN